MKTLLARVNAEAFDIDNIMWATPWPESSLKEEFYSIDPAMLCSTALILSRYAIWNPDRSFCEVGNGGWYKFINYADQTIRLRAKLPEEGARYEDQWGMGLSIIDGLARVEFDVREKFGFYAYISLATDKVIEAIRSAVWPRYPGREEHPQERAEWVQRCLWTAEKLQTTWRPGKGAASLLFDIGAIDGHPKKENLTPKECEQHGSKGRAKVVGGEASRGASLFGLSAGWLPER